MDDAEVIAALGLAPHPEGGWYVETFRDGGSTAIYHLLRGGERSHWHRVAQAEVFHHYAGGALRLQIAGEDGTVEDHLLGDDMAAGQRPQVVVPAGAWQAGEPVGGWVLIGCTVAPPFEFATFELAPPGWSPS